MKLPIVGAQEFFEVVVMTFEKQYSASGGCDEKLFKHIVQVQTSISGDISVFFIMIGFLSWSPDCLVL